MAAAFNSDNQLLQEEEKYIMDERTKKERMITDPDELEKAVGGVEGGCWNSARFVAPDGHDVGCDVAWYRPQFGDRDFLR